MKYEATSFLVFPLSGSYSDLFTPSSSDGDKCHFSWNELKLASDRMFSVPSQLWSITVKAVEQGEDGWGRGVPGNLRDWVSFRRRTSFGLAFSLKFFLKRQKKCWNSEPQCTWTCWKTEVFGHSCFYLFIF